MWPKSKTQQTQNDHKETKQPKKQNYNIEIQNDSKDIHNGHKVTQNVIEHIFTERLKKTQSNTEQLQRDIKLTETQNHHKEKQRNTKQPQRDTKWP